MTDDERTNAIAVGLDGSPAATAALHWAAAEAGLRRVPLRLVHAREPDSRPEPEAMPPGPTGREIVDAARDDVVRRRPELHVIADVIDEKPEEALLTVSAETRMLVLGSYGTRRLPSFFLGGVSLSTVARAEHPVVLVRAEEDPEAREAGTAHEPEQEEVHPHGPRVVVALGLDHDYANLLRFAFETAEVTGLPLHVVHAIRLPSHVYVPGGPVVPHIAVQYRKEVEGEVRELVRPWAERHPRVELRAALRLEGTAQAVVHEAEGSDLLVVGRCRKHRTALGPRIGPVAHAAVHHAACPVAVVPHD
ncbi:universal stress protein [Streptomyces sp. DSM 42041]|uniref:Universal stress protein n=1 Tax=Streptomyces hazeniae TaxID=3075538 RepID=A0ABU2NMF1_9ACTN|nr:universal stress protein [Streptomyces sp. DSM 42041]MDT0378155.1 universal stress protein [Streptomyces sp. DSM 42041]